MEEKKLTDEEIVKAIECCSEYGKCDECPYEVNKINCIREHRADKDICDLIHRLQSENERLTEEHERIAWSKQQYLDWVHGFLSTHTDMKDRGEDYKVFDRDWMCDVFWAKIEGSIEYIIDLENQRNKLQKQVDDLKDERENMQAEILRFEDMKFTQEHCDLYSENETLKQWLKRLNAYLENEKNWSKIQTKQAVKDTANYYCNLVVEKLLGFKRDGILENDTVCFLKDMVREVANKCVEELQG